MSPTLLGTFGSPKQTLPSFVLHLVHEFCRVVVTANLKMMDNQDLQARDGFRFTK